MVQPTNRLVCFYYENEKTIIKVETALVAGTVVYVLAALIAQFAFRTNLGLENFAQIIQTTALPASGSAVVAYAVPLILAAGASFGIHHQMKSLEAEEAAAASAALPAAAASAVLPAAATPLNEKIEDLEGLLNQFSQEYAAIMQRSADGGRTKNVQPIQEKSAKIAMVLEQVKGLKQGLEKDGSDLKSLVGKFVETCYPIDFEGGRDVRYRAALKDLALTKLSPQEYNEACGNGVVVK